LNIVRHILAESVNSAAGAGLQLLETSGGLICIDLGTSCNTSLIFDSGIDTSAVDMILEDCYIEAGISSFTGIPIYQYRF